MGLAKRANVGHKAAGWRGGGTYRHGNGYLMIRMPTGKLALVHRVIWECEYGAIPPGYHIHHVNGVKDDNRLENLWLMPARAHGRLTGLTAERDTAKGQRHPKSKLTEEIVRTIRARCTAGGETKASLAREYGVAAQTIAMIVARRIWTHVDP